MFKYPKLIRSLAESESKRGVLIKMKTFLSLGQRDNCESEYLADLDKAIKMLEESESLDAYRAKLNLVE